MLGADGQQNLRGLVLVGPKRIFQPLLAGMNPGGALGVVFLDQAEGVIEDEGQHPCCNSWRAVMLRRKPFNA